MKVKHISQDNKGAFIAYIDDQQAGMMTYSVAGEDKIIADHTEVEDNFRKRGVGEELFKALIEHVKTNNIKVIPLCPFVKSPLNTELTDVIISCQLKWILLS